MHATFLVDNVMDALLPSTSSVQRAPLRSESFEQTPLLAEHGFAALVTVENQGQRTSILYDTGMGRETLVHNMDVPGIDPNILRAIVLSHVTPITMAVSPRCWRASVPGDCRSSCTPTPGATARQCFQVETNSICQRPTAPISNVKGLSLSSGAIRPSDRQSGAGDRTGGACHVI